MTVKAESTMSSTSQRPKYPSIIASGILALVSVLVIAIMCRNMYCRKMTLVKDDLSDVADVEKGKSLSYQ